MRRLETGSLVAALGAALVLVSLFLGWYQPGLTAWSAFEVWDLVLAALAVSVVLGAAAELEWWRGPVPPLELPIAGVAALVVVAAALLDHPPAATGRALEGGAWLGLGGALLMVVGGIMAREGISLSVSVEPQPRRRSPAPPPPGSTSPSGAPLASSPASVHPPPEGGPPASRGPAAVPAPAPSPNRAPGARSGPRRRAPVPPSAGADPPAPPRGGRPVEPEAPGAGARGRWGSAQPELPAAPPEGRRRWRRAGRAPAPPVDETEVTRPLPKGPAPPGER